MSAIREQIFAEIEARLKAISGVQEVERMPPGDPAKFPALHLYDDGQDPLEAEASSTRYQMSPTIEGYVVGTKATAHGLMNDLYVSVVSAMMTEPPLGGLAETIDEGGMRVEVAKLADKRRIGFAISFTISFPTRRGSPDEPA